MKISLIVAWMVSTAAAKAAPHPEVQDREDPAQVAAQAPTPAAPQGVAINEPTISSTRVPITMQLFAGPPRTKTCRGSPMVNMRLPDTASTDVQFATGQGQCYDLPDVAYCAVFMANMEDGCEAKLFTEEKCTSFVNLAVFLPEVRPIGGVFRSMQIRCGVIPIEPAPLSLGGLGGQQKPV